MLKRILLDKERDSICPIGYTLINSEVEFFNNAFSKDPLMISGLKLSSWAQTFYSGRCIETEDAPSPIHDLSNSFPSLNKEQIISIINIVGEKINSLIKPLSAESILQIIYPSDIWIGESSILHAAKFLLWFEDTKPEAALLGLIKIVCDKWISQSGSLRYFYNIENHQQANRIIKEWLGIEFEKVFPYMQEFPIIIPEKWMEIARQYYKKEIIRYKGQLINKLSLLPIPRGLKILASEETLSYFEKNPEEMNSSIYNNLLIYLSGINRERLVKLYSISPPTELPKTPEKIINWFKKEYLPYREWQLSLEKSKLDETILSIGREFAEWLLDYYPKALNSKQHISFFLSQNILFQKSDRINLFIILDGLNIVDARKLIYFISNHKGKHIAVILENSMCFSPIPTVTDFSKGALIHGAQPSLIENLVSLGDDISESANPKEVLSKAKSNDIFIWKFQEPDHTYHTKNKNSTLRFDVEGQINTIANKIIDIIENVKYSTPLRIIITTDHGRILTISEGDIAVPKGMEAHGRAAWGNCEKEFPKTGYIIEDDIAYISKDRFGLSHHAAIILSDHRFKDSKGRKRNEWFTHGGIFPEEVIIPWVILERDIPKPELEISILGKAQANYPGKLKIELLNPSEIKLIFENVEVDFGQNKKSHHPISRIVNQVSQETIEIEIPSWPSSDEITNGSISATLTLPNGERIMFTPSLEKMLSDELYSRPDILEGLDL